MKKEKNNGPQKPVKTRQALETVIRSYNEMEWDKVNLILHILASI